MAPLHSSVAVASELPFSSDFGLVPASPPANDPTAMGWVDELLGSLRTAPGRQLNPRSLKALRHMVEQRGTPHTRGLPALHDSGLGALHHLPHYVIRDVAGAEARKMLALLDRMLAGTGTAADRSMLTEFLVRLAEDSPLPLANCA